MKINDWKPRLPWYAVLWYAVMFVVIVMMFAMSVWGMFYGAMFTSTVLAVLGVLQFFAVLSSLSWDRVLPAQELSGEASLVCLRDCEVAIDGEWFAGLFDVRLSKDGMRAVGADKYTLGYHWSCTWYDFMLFSLDRNRPTAFVVVLWDGSTVEVDCHKAIGIKAVVELFRQNGVNRISSSMDD